MVDRWLYAWALGAVSFGGASLLVPLYVVQLGGTPVDLGVLAATAAAAGAPGAVAFGRLAGRIGHRRRLVVATLATVAVALAVLPLLASVPAVVAANAVLWLVVAAAAPVLTLLVVADAPEFAWSARIGRLNRFQGYGWAGGLVLGAAWPLIGGLLGGGVGGTRMLFWLLAACAAAGAVGAARLLPRPDPDAPEPSDRQGRRIARLLARSGRGVREATYAFSPNRLYWTTRSVRPGRLRDRFTPALVAYLLAAGLFFGGSAAFWAPLPLFLTDVGFGSGGIFALYLVSTLASATLYERAGALASRSDLRRLQSVAVAVRGAAFPAVALVAGLGSLAVEFGAAALGLAAVGATWAVMAVAGTAIVVRLAPAAVRGEALGIYTALSALAGGAGGIVGGWAAGFGYPIAFALAGGLVIAGALLVGTLGEIPGDGRTAPSGSEHPVGSPTAAGEEGSASE